MCEVCTEAVHSVALWKHGLHYNLGHVWSMYRSSPLRSTLNTGYSTTLDMWSMYRSSPFRSTLNPGYITTWDMCEVCTEAVHSVALWTWLTLQLFGHVWSICTEAVHSVALWTRVTLQLGTCEVCTEAVHSVALWTRVTLQLWTCVTYVPKQSIP